MAESGEAKLDGMIRQSVVPKIDSSVEERLTVVLREVLEQIEPYDLLDKIDVGTLADHLREPILKLLMEDGELRSDIAGRVADMIYEAIDDDDVLAQVTEKLVGSFEITRRSDGQPSEE